MSAIEDELAEVFGSPEAVQQHIAFMREQVNIARALWNVPAMPMDQRLSVLAERARILAELLRSGEVDKIELNARRDILEHAGDDGTFAAHGFGRKELLPLQENGGIPHEQVSNKRRLGQIGLQ